MTPAHISNARPSLRRAGPPKQTAHAVKNGVEMKQKIIAGMLAVMMLMTMLPTTAFAAVGDFVQDAQDMVPQTPPLLQIATL